MNYMKFHKVEPRLNNYDYRTHKYAIYVYLDPFVVWDKKVAFECCGKKQKFHFYYLPIYVGKLESPIVYRQNHHLHFFRRGIKDVQNQYKEEYLREIERKMEEERESLTPDPLMPKSWDDYKKGWIIILKTFSDKESLREFEKKLIQAIGVRRDNSGPLVNIVKG